MGRFCCEDEGDLPDALYERALARSIRSRNGQRFLGELERALRALPAPRLTENALYVRFTPDPEDQPRWVFPEDHGVTKPGDEAACAIGAVLRFRLISGLPCYKAPVVEYRVGRKGRLFGVRRRDGQPDQERVESLDEIAGMMQGTGDHYLMLAASSGISQVLAHHVGWLNDELWEGVSPERRHELFLEWIEQNRIK